MKKLAVIFVVLLILAGNVFAQERLTLDLKTLSAIKNSAAFTKNYDDFLILFPDWPSVVDFTRFDRITVKAKYFDANNNEIRQSDSKAMVTLIYDPEGDLRGPDMGPGPNTPLKQMNLGGSSGTIHKDNGSPLKLTKPPKAILFQNSDNNVKFIEVTEITFFKR